MPSTYAHRLFGEEMLKIYPKGTAAICMEYLSLYNIGLHGPDILFYYKPLKDNPVQKIGYSLHSKSAAVFFNHAADVINSCGDYGAYLSYAAGFICHFALDGACHSYIENKLTVSKVKHTEIESEFDKYLLRKEGKDPFKEDLVSHIKFDATTARIIAEFFDGLSDTGERVCGKDILSALKSVLFYNRLMQGKNPFKRAVVNVSLKVSGNYPEMHGMMFSKKDIKECADSNLRLEKLFKKAEENCLVLTDEFISCVKNKAPMTSDFAPTFGPAEGWQKIPILTLEEEKVYEI